MRADILPNPEYSKVRSDRSRGSMPYVFGNLDLVHDQHLRQVAALYLGTRDGKDLAYVGKVGSGWNRTTSTQIRKALDAVVSLKSKLSRPIKKSKGTWVEPKFYADVEYRDATTGETPRDVDPGHTAWPRYGTVLASQALSLSDKRRAAMEIKEHMEVIGADGVHVGTVDRVEGGRIKLTKKDSGEGSHKDHHHFIDKGLVADVEGNKVRLSANANVAVTMEEEK